MDKCKTGLGYNDVLPPYTRNFMPLKPDLVYLSLDDFVDMNESVSVFVVEKPTVDTNEPKTARKENGAPIIEDWMSKSEEEDVPKTKTVEMLNKPSFSKINFVKSTKQIKSPRKTSVDKNRQNTPSLRGNKRKWNQHMSQKLGNDFEMFNKACHVCGSFDHLKNDCNNWYNNGRFAKPVWTNVQKVNKQNSSKLTYPSPKRNMVPRTVLTRFGLITLNTARTVNTVQPRTAVNNAGPMKNANTIKGTRVNTSRPKAVLSVVKGTNGNAVKALASWVWRPKHKVLDHGNPQQELKDKGVFDSGCSRHMTGNRSYLTNYEEIDGGFVAFGGNSKGGKITGKCKIRTGKLYFEDVYFVKELKFNLFSDSQMCDKKNIVLFTNTACIVLSSDFKLTDESHVLLKVPRKDNMYSVDLKNVVPQGGLTCLFVKATPDESNLWHRRLGHGVVITSPPTDPYELFLGRKPALSFMRPFGCPVTILNTIDHLGKFYGKADEGFFVGYSTNSKAFRVFNSRTRIVEENMHVQFSENIPNIAGSGPNWLFDIDALTKSMNYKPNVAGNQSNGSAGTKACDNVGKAGVETVPDKDYILLPLWTQDSPFSSSSKDSPVAGFKPSREEEKKDDKDPGNEDSKISSTNKPRVNQEKDANVNSTNNINIVSLTINASGIEDNVVDENIVYGCADDLNMPELEEIGRFSDAEDDISGADMNNLDTYFQMDVKSAFLYGKIGEEVYVCQPPGFEDPYFPDRVYKVEKALYGLHQAPKAWKEMCTEFEKIMHKKFQMSSLGELTFFLGLQVKQKEDGIFISQDKYVNEILNKFGFSDVKTASTPMEAHKTLLKDVDGKDVDQHLYISMIGSLMYLTSSRPNIMFVTKIHIDNKSTICIVKNPVFHSNTKHIEIRHHFIRDSNEKKLIQMIKIHTDQNVIDLLTKSFDVSRFQYLIASIGMLNL
ncbi:putative ribonuclease H-like domain-containing protein [Tanacetum coccineum]